MGVQGGLGVLNPPGRSQGDVPSLLIIDRRRDKLHDFILLPLCSSCFRKDACWQVWNAEKKSGIQEGRRLTDGFTAAGRWTRSSLGLRSDVGHDGRLRSVLDGVHV